MKKNELLFKLLSDALKKVLRGIMKYMPDNLNIFIGQLRFSNTINRDKKIEYIGYCKVRPNFRTAT